MARRGGVNCRCSSGLAVVAEVGPVFGGGVVCAPDGAALHRAMVKTAAANCFIGQLAISRSLDWCRIKAWPGWKVPSARCAIKSHQRGEADCPRQPKGVAVTSLDLVLVVITRVR